MNELPAWTMLETLEKAEIDSIIHCCDGALDIPVTQRTIYADLLEKIHQKGTFFFAYDGSPRGYCAFYANDSERRNGYISLIAVAPECQNMHIGTKLLNESFETMRTYGMKKCLLEVRKNNQKAIHFYKSKKFSVIEEREESYLMEYEL